MRGLTFDLIILDIMMPGETGLALTTSLRNGGHDLPIFMLSALADTDDRIAGLATGSDDYLAKPSRANCCSHQNDGAWVLRHPLEPMSALAFFNSMFPAANFEKTVTWCASRLGKRICFACLVIKLEHP
jgi:DNA-binding NarL/FixJ family response regulator